MDPTSTDDASGSPREVELKLELDPGRPVSRGLRRALPAGGEVHRLLSRYFDTPEGRLRKQGLVLRVRRDGDAFIQTLKAVASAGSLGRSEWEAPVAGDVPDLSRLPDDAPGDVVAAAGPLSPVFETEVERTVWRVTRGGSDLELALDEGVVRAGAATEALREIEIELKSGSLDDVFDLARELARAAPVRFGARSKSERGALLARGKRARPVKAEPIALAAGADAAQAFQAVARACIRHFRLNEAMVLDAREPEALHQARVAMRRLRSALALFRRVVAGEEADRMRAELRAVSRALGAARNLDVYLSRKIPDEAARNPGEPGLAELARWAEADRRKAYDRVEGRLRSKRFRALMLDLVAFVECGAWLRDEALAPARAQSAAHFAARTLSRRWRKVRRSGRRLDRLAPEARHRVRIEAKKLRYASEFFASLFTRRKERKRHRAFVEALEGLQSSLGDLNDIATGHAMAVRLARRAGAGLPPALLFAAGHLSGAAEGREAAEVARAVAAHRALRKAEPFWS